MLAMHYAIALTGADQVASVRERAAVRGPYFDGMDGLCVKLFLVDPVDPCYATFYLWRDADAAQAFLEGSFFHALCQTFGRPKVQLLLTTATDLPFETGSVITLTADASTEAMAGIRALDPRSGIVLALSPAPAKGRRFEVLYRAKG